MWVSTHSPIVLAHTELPDVLATRLGKDGSVTVVAGDKHSQLRDWQGTLDIGTLFAAGCSLPAGPAKPPSVQETANLAQRGG